MTTPAIDADLAVIAPWWTRLAITMPSTVVGLWFGITEVVWPEGLRPTMYVAGCPTFDLDDETAEWATDYVWWPDDRYVVPPSLASMPAADSADLIAVLKHATTLIRRLQPQHDVDVQGVAVGFDDGDFTITWPAEELRP